MFGKEEWKDKPKKNIINDRDPRSRSRRRDLAIDASRDRDVDRDLCRRQDRNQLRDLATAWDRAVDRDLHDDRQTGDRRRLELRVRRRSSDWLFSFFSSRAPALSLSLSLFPEMFWSENEGRKSFSGQRWKYWSTRSHFSENIIFRDSQTCGKGWKWFPEIIFTQNKCTRSLSLFHLKYPTPVWYFRFFFFVVSDLWLIMRFGSSLSNNNKYKKNLVSCHVSKQCWKLTSRVSKVRKKLTWKSSFKDSIFINCRKTPLYGFKTLL